MVINGQRKTTSARLSARCLVVFALVLLAPWAVPPQSARGEPPANLVCPAAQQLIKDALPRRALVLMDTQVAVSMPGSTTDIPPCNAEREAALRAVESSLRLSKSARYEIKDKKWTEALKSTKEALKNDRENDEAESARIEAKAGLQQAEAETKAALSEPQRLVEVWEKFSARYLAPVWTLFAPVAVMLAVLLVLARLLLTVRWPVQEALRGPSIALGSVGMTVGAITLTLALAEVPGPPSSRTVGVSLVAGALALGFAVVLLMLRGAKRGTSRPQNTVLVGAPALVIAVALSALLADVATIPQTWDVVAAWCFGAALILLGLMLLHAMVSSRGRSRADAGVVDRFLLTTCLVGLVTFFLWIPATWLNLSVPWPRLSVILMGATVAVVGIAFSAQWMATRLRLEVKVSDEKAEARPADAGRIVALLSELGVEKPRGLEVPRGTDTTALEGAFAILSANPIVKTVQGIVTGFLGSVPWKASVDVKDDDHFAVAVMWNGHTVGSTTIDRKDPSLRVKAADAGDDDDSKNDVRVDLTRMAAAFILTVMATQHSGIREGLAGATDWKSIGLQNVAMADILPEKSQDRVATLGRALALDPGNHSAVLAYQHALHRLSVDGEELTTYRDWLHRFADSTTLKTLELRARFTQLLMATNALFAEGVDRTESMGQAMVASNRLATLVRELEGNADRDLVDFCERITTEAEPVQWLYGRGPREAKVPTDRLSPYSLYHRACYFASVNDRDFPDRDASTTNDRDELAVALLRPASREPRIREWITTDPQLRAFRERSPYQRAFLKDPRTDFFDLPPVATYARSFRNAGYTTVQQLRAGSREVDGWGLLVPFGDQRALIARLATLQGSMTSCLGAWDVEVLHELLALDLVRADAQLWRAGAIGVQRATAWRVASAVVNRCTPGMQERTALAGRVFQWFRRIAG